MSAPFFKFSAVEWIAGAVQAVDYAERGIFIELCARTWMQGAPLRRGDKLARLLHINADDLDAMLKELASLDIVELPEDGTIRIKFLAEQADEIAAVSEVRAEMGRRGGIASGQSRSKTKQNEAKASKAEANAKQNEADKDKDKDKDKKESPLKGAKEKPDADAPPSSFVTSCMKKADFTKWGEAEFLASVAEAVKGHPEYVALTPSFTRYWLEPDKTGKPRFALQKTWSTAGRLATWFQRAEADRRARGGGAEKPGGFYRDPKTGIVTGTGDEASYAEWKRNGGF